jgi:hypothetical protein
MLMLKAKKMKTLKAKNQKAILKTVQRTKLLQPDSR